MVDVAPWDGKTRLRDLKNPADLDLAFEDVVPDNVPQVEGGQKSNNQKNKKNRPDYMNAQLFLYWLECFNKSLVAANPSRKIILLIDNATSHTSAMKYQHFFPSITLLPLPPNSTSITQPLDVGIIAVFKHNYRQLMIKKRLQVPAENTQAITKEKVSNYDAWHLIVAAWKCVKPASIKHCFCSVPIFGKQQKTLLSAEVMDPDVSKALSALQQSFPRNGNQQTSQARSIDSWYQSSSASNAESQDANVAIVSASPPVSGYHNTLLASMANILDGAPFIYQFVDEMLKDELFMSFFSSGESSSKLLSDVMFPSDDEDDGDYTPDLDTRSLVKDENGNPSEQEEIRK